MKEKEKWREEEKNTSTNNQTFPCTHSGGVLNYVASQKSGNRETDDFSLLSSANIIFPWATFIFYDSDPLATVTLKKEKEKTYFFPKQCMKYFKRIPLDPIN